MTPNLYQRNGSSDVEWNKFTTPVFEYDNFNNSAYDMELIGLYQYMARDLYVHFLQSKEVDKEICKMIDEFFEDKNEHKENEMLSYVQRVYGVNDAILDGDYYKYLIEKE